MAVDPYALCPCGSGKKLKFCCSDVVGDIEKIHRMLGGEQPRAALRHVEQALASHPGRASLLDLKATIELSLEEFDAARESTAQFLASQPDSPTAWACQALLLAETEGDARAMVAALQRAMALIDRDMPHRVYEAIGAVGQSLLVSGHVLAAQAHLWLHAALAPEDDMRSREILMGLNHYAGLPLLLRDQLRLKPWPEEAAWRDEAATATDLAGHGRWQQAVEAIDRLGQKYGAEPVLVYNRALLGGWLADERSLAAGFHAYAQLDVPLDEAVEAEAIAQLLDPDLKEAQFDRVSQTYEVHDLDALAERLAADRRVVTLSPSDEMLAQLEQPHPRHLFTLLDRPQPKSGAELTRGDVPRVAGMILIYGRQTDRPERLVFSVDKGPDYSAAVEELADVAGDALGQMTEETVAHSQPVTDLALNWRWHFPHDTPIELRQRLLAEERRAAIVERWPEYRRPTLGGKTPREASGDASLRTALLASILILEQGSNVREDGASIAELRSALGLSQPEPIGGADVATLPLARVGRLQFESVSEDDLVRLYRRAILSGAEVAALRLASELVRRPEAGGRAVQIDAHRRLISGERDRERALALIDEARQQAIAAGESPADWDLVEFEYHITGGDAANAKRSLDHIQRTYANEPEVAMAVYRMLDEMGLLPPEAGAGEPGLGDEMLPAGAGAAAEPGRIWTPDSERPAGGGGSKLWTPS